MLEKPSLLPPFSPALGSIGVINPSERLACFPLAGGGTADAEKELKKLISDRP